MKRIANRLFNREYQAVSTYEAGISLTGAEVKSVRAGNIRLEDSYVKIMGGVPQLINAEISIYKYAAPRDYEPRRTRALLLHKREILKIETKKKQGGRLTIVPVACYNKGRRIKLELALAKGKHEIAKKKHERARDMVREIEKEIKDSARK